MECEMRTTPEGITVTPVEFHDVIEILNSDALKAVEEPIAAACGLKILRDWMPIQISIAQAELSVCGMSVEECKNYLAENQASIVEFALRLLNDNTEISEEEFPEGEEQDPSEEGRLLGISNGLGVTWTIYHQFVSRRSPKELRAFLKNRQIPFHAKYAKQLASIYASISAKDIM
jgi:hypothetical protein